MMLNLIVFSSVDNNIKFNNDIFSMQYEIMRSSGA